MPAEQAPWVMPEWMEPYRDLIGNTGGNSVEELYNDRTTAQVNLIRAALALAVRDQVDLLYRLHSRGMLAPIPAVPRSPARCDARAVKGTGTGVCDRLLDAHGACDRAADHL
jgi:hypothetical protein